MPFGCNSGSGLDYSKHVSDITEAFMKGDYGTALECFTVIEESLPELADNQKDAIIKQIDQYPLSEEDDKKALVSELRAVIGSR